MFLLPWFESHAISTIITPQGIAYLEKTHNHFGWSFRHDSRRRPDAYYTLIGLLLQVHSNFPKNRRYFRLKNVYKYCALNSWSKTAKPG